MLDGILQAQGPRGRLDRPSAARAAPPSAAPAACASTARPRWPATPASPTRPARPARQRDRRRADGQHARDQGPDRGHGRRPLEEDPAAWCRGCCPTATPPEREYIVPAEAMIDVTQSMACIQCGVCVGACLSLEVDPEFIGPAALAKAYRFVGDPRDGQHRGAPARPRRGPARHLRLHPLLRLHRGLPQGRGADEPDHAPAPPRHRRLRHQGQATTATATRRRFVDIIEKWGTLHEAQLLPRSFGDGSMIKGPGRAQRRQAAAGEPAHRRARAARRARSRRRRRCCTPSCPTRRT